MNNDAAIARATRERVPVVVGYPSSLASQRLQSIASQILALPAGASQSAGSVFLETIGGVEGGILISSAAAVECGGVGVEQGMRIASVQEYLPFVKKVAMRMAKRLPSHVAFEDLMSAGVVGLIEAMNRYDPDKVSEFEKYAEFRVRGHPNKLRRRDLMARDARLESKNLEAVIDGKEYGRSPEEEEIAERLDLSVDELRTKLEKLTPVRVLSFTDVFPASAPSDEPNPFDLFAQQELLEHLAKATRSSVSGTSWCSSSTTKRTSP